MKLETIEQSHYYHIYNRGINGENIFKTEENKRYFLQLFGKYVAQNLLGVFPIFSMLMRRHSINLQDVREAYLKSILKG